MFSAKLIAGIALAAVAATMLSDGRDPEPQQAATASSDVRIGLIAGYAEDHWSCDVIAGQPYIVLVDGDDSSDLDLFVTDVTGTEVGRDTRVVDECIVTFVARCTGTYGLRIKNCGGSSNLYALAFE